MTKVTASMTIDSWNEEGFAAAGEVSLAQADSPASFTGDLQGSSTVRTLLTYPTSAAPSFVALQAFEGTVLSKSGSVVLQQLGTFKNNAAHVELSVVPGSGTGELEGVSGSGSYIAPSGEPVISVTLDLEF